MNLWSKTFWTIFRKTSHSECMEFMLNIWSKKRTITGSLNSKCDKAKAQITIKYWLKISTSGVITCTRCGHFTGAGGLWNLVRTYAFSALTQSIFVQFSKFFFLLKARKNLHISKFSEDMSSYLHMYRRPCTYDYVKQILLDQMASKTWFFLSSMYGYFQYRYGPRFAICFR